MRNSEEGVIYVATGKKYVDEAVESARTVRTNMPGVPICLFTDVDDIKEGTFSDIRKISDVTHTFQDKIGPMLQSPYIKTLFLDTDTYMHASCRSVFSLLDRFDLAAARAPRRSRYSNKRPVAYSDFNTGVLAYRKTETVIDVFQEWLRLYQIKVSAAKGNKHPPRGIGDQASFSEAVYASDVSVYVLPPEFNLRANMMGFVSGEARIIHCRHLDMKELARVVNESDSSRVVIPSLKSVSLSNIAILSPIGRTAVKVYTYPKQFADRILKRFRLK